MGTRHGDAPWPTPSTATRKPLGDFWTCRKLAIIRGGNLLPRSSRRNLMAPSIRAILLIASASLACTLAAPAFAKECYAPDTRSQERAFSRAVITEGGKTVWLGGQIGSPNLNFEGQTREAFAELDKSIK